MSKQILVNSSHYETRVAVLENGEIRQLHIEREEDKNVVGNVYLGVVKRVLPGMQAAFLELGLERTAFLYVDDIIDEPFGSDVDYLDDEEGEDASSDATYETESREENMEDVQRVHREPSGLGEEGSQTPEEESAEDSGPLIIEDDNEPAPILVAPESPSDDNSETEGDESSEDDGEESDDDSEDEELVRSDYADINSEMVEPGAEEPVETAALQETTPEETRSPETPGKETAPSQEQRGQGRTDFRRSPEPSQPGDEQPPRQNEEHFDDHEDNIGNRKPSHPGDRDRQPQGPGDRPHGRGRHGGHGRRGGFRDRNHRPHRDNREGRDNRDTRDNREPRDNRDNRDNRDRGGSGGGRRDEHRTEGREGRAPRRPGRHRRGGHRGQRFNRRRQKARANIQDLLKEGQEILVQVAKAPIGTKGARLTTHISLPGRNLVLMPTVKHLGISRRIGSDRERRRLRDIFTKKLQVKGVGFIIRTVAEGKSFRDLKADADYLIQTWLQIKKGSKEKRAPALIHEDLSLSMRSVRDFFTEDVDSFVIDNAQEHEGVMRIVSQFMPRLKPRVKLFKGPSQIFEHYGIEAEISRALNKKVWLKSGGYLLFDQSEALTAIDVNTGRYVGSKSLEETILKTNLEAVKEVAYQLRVRNVGGIIIIDLIDMESMANREKVYNALQEALSEDKSKTNILKISDLGLVEMTRKRTHEDLVRYLTEACPHCDGRGYTKSRRTVSFEIFREIEKEALSNTKNIVVFAAPGVVNLLNKEESKHVKTLQEQLGKQILIKPDPEFHTEQFEVFGKH